jgi:hypothetical protein
MHWKLGKTFPLHEVAAADLLEIFGRRQAFLTLLPVAPTPENVVSSLHTGGSCFREGGGDISLSPRTTARAALFDEERTPPRKKSSRR